MGRLPCCEKAHTNKGAWTKDEDQRLIAHINAHGEGCWRSLPTAAGLLRCGKSCRLRWINYLRPDLKRGNFTEEEDKLIVKLHEFLGNKWSIIAGRMPGRTDNEIKNYWNTHLKRKLLARGVDPQTHRPLTAHYRMQHTAAAPCFDEDSTSPHAEHIGDMGIDLSLSISPPCQTSLTAARLSGAASTTTAVADDAFSTGRYSGMIIRDAGICLCLNRLELRSGEAGCSSCGGGSSSSLQPGSSGSM